MMMIGKVKFIGGVLCGACGFHIKDDSCVTYTEIGDACALYTVCPNCGQEHVLDVSERIKEFRDQGKLPW